MTRTVLVLEDSEVQREIICHMIKKSGWTPMSCHSIQAAFEALRQTSFDALFLDLFVNKDNTLVYIDQFRKLAPSVPIIFMTGGHGLKHVEHGLHKARHSDDHVISKPFDESYLKDLLSNLTPTCTATAIIETVKTDGPPLDAPEEPNLDPARVSFTVDQPNSLITLRFLENLTPQEFHDAVLKAFAGASNAYLYDWLIDVRALSQDAILTDGEKLRLTWLNMTLGRDVGRRMAIIANDPAIEVFVRTAIRDWAIREFAIFQDVDEGYAWLAAITSTSTSRAEQFI